MKKRLVFLLIVSMVAGLALTTGCATKKPSQETPSLESDRARLDADIDVLPPFPMPKQSSGSLWTDGGPGAAMARDTRAFRVNDLLLIELKEQSSGSNAAETQLKRTSEQDWGAPTVFGLEDPAAAAGKFDWAKVLESSTESNFLGDGTTSRANTLTGYVSVRVGRVLPNGDLVVAGQKTVMINRERQILTLVGSVRPVDIDAHNRVQSAQVGDLTVRLWGKGEVDDTVREGWFMRIMKRIWPF